MGITLTLTVLGYFEHPLTGGGGGAWEATDYITFMSTILGFVSMGFTINLGTNDLYLLMLR